MAHIRIKEDKNGKVTAVSHTSVRGQTVSIGVTKHNQKDKPPGSRKLVWQQAVLDLVDVADTVQDRAGKRGTTQ